MAGKLQQAPVVPVGSPVGLLLHQRYAQYKTHRVSLDAIARALMSEGTTSEQRNLAAKIGRFFRDGSGALSQRWSYLETEIRLGFPEAERQARISACADLYLTAFPNATDCPYRRSPQHELSFADYVRLNIEETMRLLGRPGAPEELSDDDLRRVADQLMPLLDGGSLYNPCLHWMSTLRDDERRSRSPEDLQAITQCDETLAAFDRVLAEVTRGAASRLRAAISAHRSDHRRALAGPATAAPLPGGAAPHMPNTPDTPAVRITPVAPTHPRHDDPRQRQPY